MKLLQILFFFVLVQVIVCTTYGDIAKVYDELGKDECFKRIYVCGDERVSVTGGTGRLATEPHRFSEICRRNKEFIACIEEAADFCSGKLTNASRLILDNRRSLKLFCTDLEWKKNYFSSVQCLNENEKAVVDECIKEEDEYKDDRPIWCLIPEPCEALERVFFCTIRKMKSLCGSVAAEVHRRMHILKMENRDIVCEIRIRNPLYCRYERKRPSLTEAIKRIGSMSANISEIIDEIFLTALINNMDKHSLLLNEENIANLLESEEYKLRKAIFKTEVDEKFGIFFKKCKIPKSELPDQPDLSEERFSQLFSNIKEIISRASSQSSKYGSALYENVFNSCGTEEIRLADCLRRVKGLARLKSFSSVARISEELNLEFKSLSSYIIDLFELLSCNEDFFIYKLKEDSAIIAWKNLTGFPLESLNCNWKYHIHPEKQMFTCNLQLRPHEDVQQKRFPINVNDFLKSFPVESLFTDSVSGVEDNFDVTSLFTDAGSGVEGDTMSSDKPEMSQDFSVMEALNTAVGIGDIHRMGQQMVFLEDIDEELLKEYGTGEKSSEQNVELHIEADSPPANTEETYIEAPPHSPIDLRSYVVVVGPKSDVEKPDLGSSGNSDSHVNFAIPESGVGADSEEPIMKDDLKHLLEKIASALNERFTKVELKVHEVIDTVPDLIQKSRHIRYPSNEPNSAYINKSFQTNIYDLLEQRLQEYINTYSIYSKLPTQMDDEKYESRSKRSAVNERQNSKMDKSFTVEPSNDSGRVNTKFMNFKGEL